MTRWLGGGSAVLTLFVAVTVAAAVAASCGGNGAEVDEPPSPAAPDPTTTVLPDPPDPPEAPAPAAPAGVIVDVSIDDLPPGFEAISFYHDIPGLLRDLEDDVLSDLGARAREAEQYEGQGFANSETGELVFTITILLDTAAEAEAIVAHIDAQPVERILEFISPDETLFEEQRHPDPPLGDRAVQYFLRYGVEEDSRRLRDVVTDLVVFADGASVIFVLRSVSLTEERGPPAPTFEVEGLGRIMSERMAEARASVEAAAG